MSYFTETLDLILNESSKDKEYYRVTSNGDGVYQDVKMKYGVTSDEWKEVKNSSTWLPLPPNYKSNHTSYFTKQGIDKFKKSTLPILSKYTNDISIKKVTINKDANIVYKDKYQIVIER